MICPIRKGGPCEKEECAWYIRVERACAVVVIALEKEAEAHPRMANFNVDDDAPF